MKETKQANEKSKIVLNTGGKVDEAAVTLRFFGDDLDPDELTRILNCKPTEAYKKGDVVTTTMRPRTIKTGQWFLSFEKNSEQDLEEQILALFEKLPEDLEIWKNLSERFDLSIYCSAWLEGWSRDILLSHNMLKQMSDRNIKIRFAIYCDCDDEEVKILTDELNKKVKA